MQPPIQIKPIRQYIAIVHPTIKLPDFSSSPGTESVRFPTKSADKLPEQIIPAVRHRKTYPAMNQMSPPTKFAQLKKPVANLSMKLLCKHIARDAVRKEMLVIISRKKPK